ncbi:MAG: amidohydrolase family protein, partial [Longimicrobiales bacterium]
MRRVLWLATALLLSGSPALAQSNEVAFVNTNVLVMDRERVLEDHTVLIRGGIIQEVAPSQRVRISEGATVIDGRGLFLMPGLADMHAILPGPGDSDG